MRTRHFVNLTYNLCWQPCQYATSLFQTITAIRTTEVAKVPSRHGNFLLMRLLYLYCASSGLGMSCNPEELFDLS